MWLTLLLAVPLPGLPQTAKEISAFVPSGWEIEDRVEGQLDAPAVVLTLAQKQGDERQRALVVVHASQDSFTLLASNQGLLGCVGCLGVRDWRQISIAHHVLIIELTGGSRENFGATYRYRVEKSGLRLIGNDHYTADAVTGERNSVSKNLVTGATVTETQAAAEEGKAPKPMRTKRTQGRPVQPLPTLEETEETSE